MSDRATEEVAIGAGWERRAGLCAHIACRSDPQQESRGARGGEVLQHADSESVPSGSVETKARATRPRTRHDVMPPSCRCQRRRPAAGRLATAGDAPFPSVMSFRRAPVRSLHRPWETDRDARLDLMSERSLSYKGSSKMDLSRDAPSLDRSGCLSGKPSVGRTERDARGPVSLGRVPAGDGGLTNGPLGRVAITGVGPPMPRPVHRPSAARGSADRAIPESQHHHLQRSMSARYEASPHFGALYRGCWAGVGVVECERDT